MSSAIDEGAKADHDTTHVEHGRLESQKGQDGIHLRGAPIELSAEDAALQKSINRRFDLSVLPGLALMNFFNSLDKCE